MAKNKHCGQLYPWTQSISNHLWWATETCDGDVQLLVEKWKSIIHHISNVHEWDDDPNALFPKCTLSSKEEQEKIWPRSVVVEYEKAYQFSSYWLIKSIPFPAFKILSKTTAF